MKKLLTLMILMIMLVFMSSIVFAETNRNMQSQDKCLPVTVIKLKYDMQKLWIVHAWWTRSYIVSSIAGLEDQKDVQDRLLRNQTDIENIIKPYYGAKAGNQLTGLLKEHILIAGEIIESAKKNDQANVDKFNKDWYRNADEIITFLTTSNPNWPKRELTDMFYTHLKLTSDEVSFRLNKNWKGDIKTADLNENHLIKMGDFLTDGIVKQFPQKFN